MSQRSIQATLRGSMSSDTLVKSSSDSEKKSQEKYKEESVRSETTPRMLPVDSSSDTESDSESMAAEKYSKSRSSVRGKIKKSWKDVKEKFSDKSSHSPKTKKSTPFKFKADDRSLPNGKRIMLWQENGRNLFDNIKILTHDFKKSQDIITELIKCDGESFAANKFNAGDYAGLGFDFSSTMFLSAISHGALINPMEIFGSKSVITSTKTTPEELLADSEDESPRPSYALSKPIQLCASGIGPELFRNQLLNILRGIPLACPVILDASSNNLGPNELLELAHMMSEHPVIYSLDLSNNPLCPGDNACYGLIKLFALLGPVSRLYLDKTGFNDNTAEFIEYSLKENRCLRLLNLQHNNLRETGISSLICSAIPSDFFDRKKDDCTLSTIQLQNNSAEDWDPIIVALKTAFTRAHIFDKNYIPTPPAIPLQIDIPDSWIEKLSFAEPYISEIARPQKKSADDRL